MPANESSKTLPVATAIGSAFALSQAVAVAYFAHHQDNAPLTALLEHVKAMPGHVMSHLLDFSGGNHWTVSIMQVDSPHSSAEPNYVAVICGEATLYVFLYDPAAYTLQAERPAGDEYDSGSMLAADPRAMDELDAYGLYFQTHTLQPHVLVDMNFDF